MSIPDGWVTCRANVYSRAETFETFDQVNAILSNAAHITAPELLPKLADQTRSSSLLQTVLVFLGPRFLAKPDKARQSEEIDSREIVSHVRSLDKKTSKGSEDPTDPATAIDESPEETLAWRERLHHILIEEMSPDAFERLTQRMLRESGFVHVEVTGRTGDGGIDGKGIARINGLMSFHICFQCKKYKGSVGSPEIRDFRGATVGRADRGMFITTGSFTKSAIEEANRDGAAPIDLVDGDQLADKLKELALGVKTELVEKVTVDPEWFLSL